MMNSETERVAAFIHTSSVALTLADPDLPDCPVLSANAAFEELTGYAASTIVGKNCRFLQGRLPDRARTGVIRNAVEKRQPCVMSLRNYRLGGEPFNNLLTIDPITLPNKRVLLIGCQFEFAHDIDDHSLIAASARRTEDIGRIQGRFSQYRMDLRTALRLRADAAVVSVRNYVLHDYAE